MPCYYYRYHLHLSHQLFLHLFLPLFLIIFLRDVWNVCIVCDSRVSLQLYSTWRSNILTQHRRDRPRDSIKASIRDFLAHCGRSSGGPMDSRSKGNRASIHIANQYNNNSNIQFYEPRRLPPPPPRKRPASLYIPPPSSYNLGISIQSPKARPVKQQKVLQPMDAPYRHLPSPPTMSRFANPYLAPIIVGLTLPPLNMETTIQENTQEKLPGLREVVGNVVWREVKWRHNAVGGGRVLVGSPRDGQSPLGSIRSPRT
ncbi:hypothetical protein EDC01DRAFT_261446 [Geopyxis carbonaria]|nr:hypothetical protein EDC01DRAFT_261446 [Geopyxis carbonaria]